MGRGTFEGVDIIGHAQAGPVAYVFDMFNVIGKTASSGDAHVMMGQARHSIYFTVIYWGQFIGNVAFCDPLSSNSFNFVMFYLFQIFRVFICILLPTPAAIPTPAV